MSKITINRGSDLTFTGTWRDQAGTAMDLSDWTIEIFEGPNKLADDLTVVWTDATQGAYRVDLQWSNKVYSGMGFRLRVSKDGADISSPQITVFLV